MRLHVNSGKQSYDIRIDLDEMSGEREYSEKIIEESLRVHFIGKANINDFIASKPDWDEIGDNLDEIAEHPVFSNNPTEKNLARAILLRLDDIDYTSLNNIHNHFLENFGVIDDYAYGLKHALEDKDISIGVYDMSVSTIKSMLFDDIDFTKVITERVLKEADFNEAMLLRKVPNIESINVISNAPKNEPDDDFSMSY